MRAHHTPHSLPSFPVYSSAFVADDLLVLGGGGGSSRSGIKNKLRLYRIPNDETLNLLDEFELEKDEDAPMSMAANVEASNFACGINSSTEQMQLGKNENCRVYHIEGDKVKVVGSTNTLKSAPDNLEDYQKVTTMSPDGKLLAVAGNRDLAVLCYPSLNVAAPPLQAEHDIYDMTFSSSKLVVATTNSLLVYVLPLSSSNDSSPEKGKQKLEEEDSTSTLKLIKTIERPTLPGAEGASTFRAARFLPGNDKTLYTVINTVPPRTRGKSIPKRGYICKWDTDTWEVIKIRKAGEKGITCFDISPDSRLLAFGSADYTIGLLDSQTFAPLLTILKAHDFPPTTLRFNPSSKLLVSGSADNSIRAVTVPVPSEPTGSAWSTITVILITLLALVLAYLIQAFYAGSDVW